MASLVLTAAGFAIGGPLGGAIGGLVGSQIDQALFAPTLKSEGPRLSDLAVQASTYGQPIARVFGAENRIAGNVIWSSGLIETKSTTKTGGKGGGPSTETTSYTYHLDCAIALCRGPIAGVGRIWADGKLFRDLDGVQKQAQAVRVYPGSEDQLPDPAMQAALGVDNTPAHRGLAYVVLEHLELGDFGNRLPLFTFEIEAHPTATVSTVIGELCGAAGVPYLDAARTDFLDLRGYVIAGASTVRQALEPLRTAFFFDVTEANGELQFFPLDANPVARVPDWDLGARPEASEPVPRYEFKRAAPAELPRQVLVTFKDPARDYQENSKRSRRATIPSHADLSVELPIVLSASEGLSIAERMHSMAMLRRNSVSTQLPISYLHAEPGHKIVLPLADGSLRTLRATRRETRLPGILAFEAETDGGLAIGRQASAGAAPVPPQSVNLPGLTEALLLDLPILRDQDDYSGFYAAANGASKGWRGAVLYRSLDGGLNYEPLLDLAAGATIGATTDALGAADPHFWDRGNSVTVQLTDPVDTLEGRSEAEVLNGANACVIGAPGRWEVLQFRDAELVAPGPGSGATYRLGGLLRGRKGTEDAIAAHAAGDAFVLLSGAFGIFRPEMAAAETGIARYYKAASAGTLLADAPVLTFTLAGRWARPYAVAHLSGARNGAGDLAISWIRRTRLEAPWLDGADAPLGEASEAYEIEVLDAPGGAVLRTISAAAPQAVYSAADQVADFGSAPAAVSVRIFQLSARVGRGQPKEALI